VRKPPPPPTAASCSCSPPAEVEATKPSDPGRVGTLPAFRDDHLLGWRQIGQPVQGRWLGHRRDVPAVRTLRDRTNLLAARLLPADDQPDGFAGRVVVRVGVRARQRLHSPSGTSGRQVCAVARPISSGTDWPATARGPPRWPPRRNRSGVSQGPCRRRKPGIGPTNPCPTSARRAAWREGLPGSSLLAPIGSVRLLGQPGLQFRNRRQDRLPLAPTDANARDAPVLGQLPEQTRTDAEGLRRFTQPRSEGAGRTVTQHRSSQN